MRTNVGGASWGKGGPRESFLGDRKRVTEAWSQCVKLQGCGKFWSDLLFKVLHRVMWKHNVVQCGRGIQHFCLFVLHDAIDWSVVKCMKLKRKLFPCVV